MRISFIIFLFSFNLVFGSQNQDSLNYNVIVAKDSGELLGINQTLDYVVVSQDTFNEYKPYKIQIFSRVCSGGIVNIAYQEKYSSTYLIEAEFSNGRTKPQNGIRFSSVKIHKKVLIVSSELTRGHYEHKFKMKNGKFVLIGFNYINSNGLGKINTIDFNLVTGRRVEKNIDYTTDKVIDNKTIKVKIKSLPEFNSFIPFQTDYY